MDPEELQKITATAKEAVKDLDADLKKVAFENILNRLLDQNLGGVKKSKKRVKRSSPKKKSKVVRGKTAESDEFQKITKKLVESINRTKYPKMFDLKLTLDKALYVLKIAKDELQIDGLVPSQISNVLMNNFRLKATGAAISMALMKAVKFVDRRPITIQGGAGYTYHLMHDGEEYLKPLIKETKQDEENEPNSEKDTSSED